jgi:ribonucleoside-triphosphate reductase
MLQVVTLNLPRIAYQSEGRERKLFELLEERVKLAIDALLLKKEVIDRRVMAGMLPMLSENYSGARLLLGVGYVGLNEMLTAYLGKELHEGEAAKLGERVVRYMHALVEQFSRDTGLSFVLTQAADENPAMRLAKLDHGMFADRLIARGDRREGSVYYTHASWVRADAELPLHQRLSIEGEFHPLCKGGAVSRIQVSEALPEVTALMEFSRKVAEHTKLRFWSYSHEGDTGAGCGSAAGRLG